VRTFPDDFYSELFRLRGLDFPKDRIQNPQYFGHLTNDIVYKRLAPGVLDELKRVTPKNDHGRRKHRYHQRLTANLGYPKLREHLGSVVTLMKLSRDYDDFQIKLDQIHPRIGDTIPLPLDDYETSRGLSEGFVAEGLVKMSFRWLPGARPPQLAGAH
jgi:P63C domain-containing protein